MTKRNTKTLNYMRLAKILSTERKPMTQDKIYQAWKEKYPGIPFSESTFRQTLYNLKRDGFVSSKSITLYKMPDNIVLSDVLDQNKKFAQYVIEEN